MSTALGRLTQRSEFLRVAAARRKWAAPGLVLQACPPADPDAPGPPRVGFTATRKIGGAVVRNRAKRLLREVFRLRAALFPAGIDLVVIAKPGAADMTFAAACREMEGVSGVLARRASDVLRK